MNQLIIDLDNLTEEKVTMFSGFLYSHITNETANDDMFTEQEHKQDPVAHDVNAKDLTTNGQLSAADITQPTTGAAPHGQDKANWPDVSGDNPDADNGPGLYDNPIDVDEEGYPWDERIHSSSKKKTVKGIWSRRRNISDELYEQVKQELRTPNLTQGEPMTPAATDIATTANKKAEQQLLAQQQAQQSQMTAQEAFGEPAAPLNWMDVIQRITAATQAGSYDLNKQTQWLAAQSLAALPLLANRPDLFVAFIEEMGI